ncbi:helix-turn-helix domain-containing protein [Companilactobacillus metriopterae]|uniref:helix-turn-helix domain-containing protein n=1 Tax=Companilactobacillus metriopterae TaxID=1909267 RepID=UPI00100B66B8|nr:helix-turn-helix transcriptional regulator [Companilactobacillus metriopterae]
MDIGSRIVFYRKKLALTQSDLAQGICSQGEISLIEKGQRVPSVEMINKLSSRLGVSIESFKEEKFYENKELFLDSVFTKLEFLVNNRNYKDMSQYLTDDIFQKCCTNSMNKQNFLSYKGIYTNYYQKNFEKALEIYRIALQETNPTSFSNLLDLPKHKNYYSKIETILLAGAASCYYLLKNYKSAEILFKIACENIENIKLQLSSDILGTIYYNYCKNSKELKKYSNAIDIAIKGLEFESEQKTIYRSAEILFELGEIYYIQRRYPLAEKSYIKSMYLSYSTNSTHFFNLLLIALKKKENLQILQKNIQLIDQI